jgi:hypothetical protein
MGAIRWADVTVRCGPREAVSAERLGILLRWLRGDVLLGFSFVNVGAGAAVADAFAVDWSCFPIEEALRALEGRG